jgi:hypothetical protein
VVVAKDDDDENDEDGRMVVVVVVVAAVVVFSARCTLTRSGAKTRGRVRKGEVSRFEVAVDEDKDDDEEEDDEEDEEDDEGGGMGRISEWESLFTNVCCFVFALVLVLSSFIRAWF